MSETLAHMRRAPDGGRIRGTGPPAKNMCCERFKGDIHIVAKYSYIVSCGGESRATDCAVPVWGLLFLTYWIRLDVSGSH